jgi:hypothetical protein
MPKITPFEIANEELLKKRKEVNEATYELDALNNSLTERRLVKTQIETEIVNKKEELANIYLSIESAKKELSDLITTTKKTIEEKGKRIIELDTQIENKMNELKKQE